MITHTFDVSSTDRAALLPHGLALLVGFLPQVSEKFAGKVMEAYGRYSGKLMAGEISGSAFLAHMEETQQAMRDEIRRSRAQASDDLPGGTMPKRPRREAPSTGLPAWMRDQRDRAAARGAR